jgi:hypothetical protein
MAGRVARFVRSLLPARKQPAAPPPSPAQGAHTGVVTARPSLKPAVSYAPRQDGDADPGEVVWTWVPYEDDPSQGKDRPVLVIGWEHDRLVAIPFTSKDHTEHPDNMEIGSGAWDHSGRRSYVKLDRVLLVDPRVVRREGGTLDRRRFDEVVDRMRTLHHWS